MSNTRVYKYLFTGEITARKFLETVNKSTGGRAFNPFCGKNADKDFKSVWVQGVGSTVFDIRLKAECDTLCNELGGCPVPTT